MAKEAIAWPIVFSSRTYFPALAPLLVDATSMGGLSSSLRGIHWSGSH
jgi:hypothetical protein